MQLFRNFIRFRKLLRYHPSGQAMPSEADEKLIERIKNAGQLMCVKMLDHIIIGAYSTFYSYARAERQRKQESK